MHRKIDVLAESDVCSADHFALDVHHLYDRFAQRQQSICVHLEKLSTAEIDFSQAREKVRLAYFYLGQAYAQWIFELLPTLDVPVTSKTFHREAYPIVQANLLKLCKQSNESSILKRLERARKFFRMGSLIGVEKLAECEDLTVKRMDKISMESLSLLEKHCKDEVSKMNINGS